MGLCYFAKVYYDFKIETSKEISKNERVQKTGIDFTWLDKAIQEAQDSYDDAITKGATPEQLQKLKGNIDQLNWVKIGQPYIETIGKSVLKWFR